MKKIKFDTTFAVLLAILVIAGGFIFSSAAFGLLARGSTNITSVVINHLVLGIGVGLVGLVITTVVDYRVWRKYAPWIFGAGLLLTALVFTPLGLEHGGGKRWIVLFGTSFQPSEALKIATIVMAAAYFAAMRSKITDLRFGLGGFMAMLFPVSIIMLLQPDMGTLGVIVISVFTIFWTAGARIRDVILIMLIGLLCLSVLALVRPYVRDRVETFFNPSAQQHAEGYQIRQSLIAIGSGGIFGRGFGQGIQKFTYLPEPMGDSIFAVAGEELGFAGTTGIILIFTLLALRGFQIAAATTDPFGMFMATGISTYLVAEAFINIAAMLSLAPLTGIPLTFMSQGGSAMLMSLASAGILLNISKNKHLKRASV